jgi:hypothetical protein
MRNVNLDVQKYIKIYPKAIIKSFHSGFVKLSEKNMNTLIKNTFVIENLTKIHYVVTKNQSSVG